MEFLEGYEMLKEIGYTKEQMDYMWNALNGKHELITHLAANEVNWTDMNINVIKTLPNQFFKAGLKLPKETDNRESSDSEIERPFYVAIAAVGGIIYHVESGHDSDVVKERMMQLFPEENFDQEADDMKLYERKNSEDVFREIYVFYSGKREE
jgi:hypothetical protein